MIISSTFGLLGSKEKVRTSGYKVRATTRNPPDIPFYYTALAPHGPRRLRVGSLFTLYYRVPHLLPPPFPPYAVPLPHNRSKMKDLALNARGDGVCGLIYSPPPYRTWGTNPSALHFFHRPTGVPSMSSLFFFFFSLSFHKYAVGSFFSFSYPCSIEL